MRVSQQQRRGRIPENIVQALTRVARIERHISAPGLQDPQQGDHHRAAAFGTHRHPFIRPHPLRPQVMRQAVGAVIQGRIAERLPFRCHGHCMRCTLHLLLKQCVQAFALRVVHPGGVPVIQHALTLGRRQNGQLTHRFLRCGFQCRHQRQQRLRHIVAHPGRLQRGHGLYRDPQGLAVVVNRQGYRVMGSRLFIQPLGVLYFNGGLVALAMAVVQQGIEQRGFSSHATAPERQRQGRLLMGL